MKSKISDIYSEYYFYSRWSWTHLLFGFVFFILLNKYSTISTMYIVIILFILHTIYEYKDYYVTYHIYGNNIEKMKKGLLYLKKKSSTKKNIFGLESNNEFHMPPQSFINSIGDTVFFMIGIFLGYHSKRYSNHTVGNILILITLVYWLEVIVSYIYVSNLKLLNKTFVDDNF